MQNTTEDADFVATTVRFPRAIRRRLEDAARSSFRPLSGEIAHRIKLSFEQPLELWAQCSIDRLAEDRARHDRP
jgi:hypothetical protein